MEGRDRGCFASPLRVSRHVLAPLRAEWPSGSYHGQAVEGPALRLRYSVDADGERLLETTFVGARRAS